MIVVRSMFLLVKIKPKEKIKQECMPVGCVPSVAVTVCVCPGCVSAFVGGGGYLPGGDVCPGGLPRGVCLTDPPVDRMTRQV